jgi:hypothetical protein
MSLIVIVVILVLSVGVAIPAAIWYLKKPSGGGGDAAVSHIKVGFENPMCESAFQLVALGLFTVCYHPLFVITKSQKLTCLCLTLADGEGDKSFAGESNTDAGPMYDTAGEVEESGYMDVAGDEDNDDV